MNFWSLNRARKHLFSTCLEILGRRVKSKSGVGIERFWDWLITFWWWNQDKLLVWIGATTNGNNLWKIIYEYR